jgi:hypothetical protein
MVLFTIYAYSLVGSILSTIERWMCPVINVILTSGWEKKKQRTKKIEEKKITHTIRTDFGFNLLHSASKLKRGVIEGTGELFWFSVFVNFSSPIYFVGFFFALNRDEDIWYGIIYHLCILTSGVYFVNNWTVDVSSN